MESKIIRGFFTGEISDELIRTPKTREYEELNRRETAVYDKLRPIAHGRNFKALRRICGPLQRTPGHGRRGLLHSRIQIRGAARR